MYQNMIKNCNTFNIVFEKIISNINITLMCVDDKNIMQIKTK